MCTNLWFILWYLVGTALLHLMHTTPPECKSAGHFAEHAEAAVGFCKKNIGHNLLKCQRTNRPPSPHSFMALTAMVFFGLGPGQRV